MNCEQFQEYISQFIDGELSSPAETELFLHLGVCEQCRTFLKNALSLRDALAHTLQVSVPASLDQEIVAQHSLTTKKPVNQNFIWHVTKSKYSFRAIGLAIIISVLTGVLFTSFWHTLYQPQQTIVCLTPLPEVEVNGYVVVASQPMKGIKQ
jgi:predicted anti-sigma-YlaC factor YlaD